MKLIKKHGIEGYDIKSIKKELTTEEYKNFTQWLKGQTVADIDGKTIVYKWDYERWKR